MISLVNCMCVDENIMKFRSVLRRRYSFTDCKSDILSALETPIHKFDKLIITWDDSPLSGYIFQRVLHNPFAYNILAEKTLYVIKRNIYWEGEPLKTYICEKLGHLYLLPNRTVDEQKLFNHIYIFDSENPDYDELYEKIRDID